MNEHDPKPDPIESWVRLLVGSAAAGSDVVLRALFRATVPDDDADPQQTLAMVRARQALVGLLFAGVDTARRGVDGAGRVVAATGRFWGGLLRPLVRSRAMDPLRIPYEFLVERGADEIDRWAKTGRIEEERSRELVARVARLPVDEIVAYLRDNPELERLVRHQAQALLARLGDDPELSAVVERQGDRYVEHLHERPETVQELIRGQSLGMAEELANVVRRRTVRADDLLERVVRTVLRRKPRESLPEPPPAVQALAAPVQHRHV